METSRLPATVRWVLYQPPGATSRDWTLDGILAGAAALLTASPYALGGLAFILNGSPSYGGRYGDPALVGFAALLFVLPLVLRRHYPLLMAVAVTVAGVIQVIVHGYPMLTVLVVPIVAYSVARWTPGAWARAVVWLGLLGSLLGPMRWVFWQTSSVDISVVVIYLMLVMVCLFAVITPYAIGRRVREAAEFTAAEHRREIERRGAQLAQAEQRARMAEIRARQTIAQELHDIVAHSLSVMIVQAEGGRALASKRPEAAAEVLDTIADTGREALGEMRRIVSVLRTENVQAEFGPAPTLGDIEDMVRRSGDRVSYRALGQPFPVPPAIGLTVYRVVQEAVTNVLKHAGPEAHAWVTLTYAATGIRAEIRDNGVGAAAFTDGQGNGLRGMYERVTTVGGRLTAHPLIDGFLVCADIPLQRGLQ